MSQCPKITTHHSGSRVRVLYINDVEMGKGCSVFKGKRKEVDEKRFERGKER